MKQSQNLTQTQRLEQRQQLSAHQVLVAKLTELSVEELRARIETECEENPWLERKDALDEGVGAVDSPNDGWDEDQGDGDSSDAPESDTVGNDSASTSDDIDWGGDEFPSPSGEEEKRSREDSEVLTFHDLLTQQIGEYDLDDHQRLLVEYLVGSLDDDGMLRTPLYQLADELDIYHGVRADEATLEHLLTNIVQEFEPWGVGARNLCECLLIQVRHNEGLPMRHQLITMLERYADEFTQKHWDVIQRRMKLSDSELAAMRRSILRLNPRPGGSVGSASAEAAQVIVPDFSVQVDDYGGIHFQLCEQGIPSLQMSEDPSEWMDAYDKQDDATMRREVLEAIRYQRNLMERGNLFIEALAQRRRSLTSVMRAIIRLQEPFFREGDETLLRPMRMEDVANLTQLDISTVSRVCRSKSVETSFGTYPLRWFFTSGTTKDGDELSVRHILAALKALVEAEDKRHPYSDEYLTDALRKQGYDVARRTVAKYREQLGIPNSRMRR